MNTTDRTPKHEAIRPVRVGVIGHRFLSKEKKLRKAVDRALKTIRGTFSALALEVVTSLAEGSDRMVARRALTFPEANLIVPLPLPLEQYLEDFTDSESKEEFFSLLEKAQTRIQLPEKTTREAAYRTSSQYILDHCDVLLVIWDGQEALGEGGTGAYALQARKRGHPMVWVHAGNRIPGTEKPTSLGKDQGKLTFENWPKDGTSLPPHSSPGAER